MAPATEAPATMAEGPTQHTQNQTPRLTAPQLRLLHRPLDSKRVGRDDKGFSHMEAWDIKRYLLRVFGFAGYDTENRELVLVREIETPNGNRSKWTVVYRAQVRLIVKDVHGRELGHWDGEAAGAGNNLPNLADSHDMAMKTATSQALKRAATHLGDAFGLSLYNNGSPDAVVVFSAAHPPDQWEKVPAPLPEPNDPPVLPEQGANADEPAIGRGEGPKETPKQAAAPAAQNAAPPLDVSDAVRAGHANRLMGQVRECWDKPMELTQIRGDGEKSGVSDVSVQGPDGEWVPFQRLVSNRIAALKAASEQRSAA